MENKATPDESAVEMRQMVMPNHANPNNTIFGGVIMSWIDIAAAMASQKHARRQTVTVHVDEISFKGPVKVGHHVLIKAKVNNVGKTSMEIGVRVESENPITGEIRLTTKAYLTFVALDEHGRPIPVPPLVLVTKQDIRRSENAKKRKAARNSLAKSLSN